MGFTSVTPAVVNSRQSAKVAAIVVCTALCSFSRFLAPKYLPIITPAPTAKPPKKKTSMLTMTVVEPIAASACLLTKLPTMIESTVL